jgi:signal transduction histidine kinase
MWDTPSPSDPATARERRTARVVDVGFAAWSVFLVWATYAMEGAETVPYHILFVSFAAVYGYRAWSLPVTSAVLGAIVVATGLVFVVHWEDGQLPPDELFEIGLMPLILGAMVWHARRRFAAQRQVEQLVDHERERRLHEHELARDTSHAVRTPLTIARGHLELVQEADVSDEVRRDVDVALAELDRIGRMASRLLAIAELERPDALSMQVIDLALLTRSTWERWSASVPRSWSLDAPAELPVRADVDVLRIVLEAIVENAVAVTGEGDAVQLVCRRHGTEIVLGVADSGPGVDPADIDRLFQRFWRSAEKREGTGLGLSYVKAAAEAHGGTVLVTRSRLDGAFIGCRLPLERPAELPDPRTEPAAEQPAHR